MDEKVAENPKIQVGEYEKSAATLECFEGYKGLRIHALTGLHDFTAEHTYKHLTAGSRILDLAAGTGAMSLRLSDAGYNVTATDYVSKNFRLHDSIPFFKADLNDHFSKGREGHFDGIIASEIIEHLENPRHFARECFKLLKDGGKIILSTPNVDNLASIINFLRSGTFQWFGEREYKHDGHITPLTQWQLKKCFDEAGFSVLWQGSFGDPDGVLKGSPRLLMLSRFIGLFASIRQDLSNQIFIAVFEKPMKPI